MPLPRARGVGIGLGAICYVLCGKMRAGVFSAFVRIADVDVPWELIEAQREDQLVLFVGAGASRSSPSNLPDFRQLATGIAVDSGVTPTPRQLEDPDVLLGDLEDQHAVDVHQRVADLLGSPSSRPNQVHEAIAALATASPEARYVS
jgi:NAD-dependent SIR2 family protein deacetylase